MKDKFMALGRCLFYCFCYIAVQAVLAMAVSIYISVVYGAVLWTRGAAAGDIGRGLSSLLMNHMSYIFLIVNPLVLAFFLLVFYKARKTAVHKADFTGLRVNVLVLAAACGVLLNTFFSSFMPFLHLPSNTSALLDSMQKNDLPVSIAALALITPVLEEVIFRGYIFNRLRRSFNSAAAVILIQALLFGLEHLDPQQSFYAFFLGLVMGVVYYKTGKLAYTIILHMAFNVFSYVISYMPGADSLSDAASFALSAASLALFALVFFVLIRIMRTSPKPITPVLLEEAEAAEEL